MLPKAPGSGERPEASCGPQPGLLGPRRGRLLPASAASRWLPRHPEQAPPGLAAASPRPPRLAFLPGPTLPHLFAWPGAATEEAPRSCAAAPNPEWTRPQHPVQSRGGGGPRRTRAGPGGRGRAREEEGGPGRAAHTQTSPPPAGPQCASESAGNRKPAAVPPGFFPGRSGMTGGPRRLWLAGESTQPLSGGSRAVTLLVRAAPASRQP